MRIPDSSAAATRAYDEIKRRIIDLAYPPGSKLSEVQLADELGLGRSPIRTAFARLKSEGWVTVSPQSGTYVKRLSEAEIAEIYDLRLLLETHATRQAAHKISAAQIDELRREFRRRVPPKGQRMNAQMFDDINELDAMFHAAVYRAAGNSLVSDILLNLFEKVTWLKKTSPSTPERMQKWGDELRRVLSALEKRDPDGAARRMLEHIGHAAESGSEQRRAHASQRPPGKRAQQDRTVRPDRPPSPAR
ncbi:MAG TPA: GntR family transcriptional regulator [Burkholderiales bacterium]|nr:GntR family transcriptional regulator [Burkholderiales bacterium]